MIRKVLEVERLKKDWLKSVLVVLGGLVLLGSIAYAGCWYVCRRQAAPTPSQTVDISPLKLSNLTLINPFFVDLDGDGQKELVLSGTDKNNIRLGQAGQAEMPLILVYKYNPQSIVWELKTRIDTSDFPGTVNYVTVSELKTIELEGSGKAIIGTYFQSSSKVNLAFFAITGALGDIRKFAFPSDEYKARTGGRWPQTVEVLTNGKLQTTEGVYKPQDPNCCPSGGSIIVTYEIDPQEGILIQSVVVKNSENLIF